MVSLALALLVSPSLCAAFLRVRSGAQRAWAPLRRMSCSVYESLLRCSLRHRWLMPVSAAAVVGRHRSSSATRLGTGFMPDMDEGAFVLDY